MRLIRFLLVVLIAAASAGCAGTPGPELAAAPVIAPPAADIDSLTLGRGPVLVAAEPVMPPPVPAAILPGPAPGGELPYTLDSGDRPRIVVFWQNRLRHPY